MNETAIELNNVTKYFKLYNSPRDRLKEALHPFGKKYHNKFYAINDISLSITKGEVVGIVGRNGSGKSTLLKIISGLLVPNQGTVSTQGKINALLELGSGLNPLYTGMENIQFMMSINNIDKDDIEKKTRNIIEFSELGDFIYQPLKNYSSGMKSRLGFAIETTMLPQILILDEVLSVGDALFQRKSFARMEKLISEGRTVLFVSHNEQNIKTICDRAILIDKGQHIFTGNADETVSRYLELLHLNDKEKKKSSSSIDTLDKKPISSAGLQTKSREYVKIHHAEITNISIVESISNEQVVTLDKDQTYNINIEAQFLKAYKNVSASISIKNDKGVVITGTSPRLSTKSTLNVNANTNINFKYQLSCLLIPSIYYLDVAITGDVDDGNEILCYIIDAVALKVLSSNKNIDMKFGLVDLLEVVD